MAVLHGIGRVLSPHPIEHAEVSYVVLAVSAMIEGTSFAVSLKQFTQSKRSMGIFEAARATKDPPAFMVLFEDGAALAGLAIVAIGTWASAHLGWYAMDGVASILVGLVLGAVSLLLARESKSLLIGERADRELTNAILCAARAEPCVYRANGVMTVQLAPDQVVAALSLQFRRDLRSEQVEGAVAALERRIRIEHPQVVSLFVRPESAASFESRALPSQD